MRILYFAWVRERIGHAEEVVALPPDVTTVATLLDWLAAQSPSHSAALAERASLKVAVNQDYAGPDQPVRDSDEIAIFPPVTGGAP